MSIKSEQTAKAKLKALGYGFNKEGELCKFDKTINKITNVRFRYHLKYDKRVVEHFDYILNEVLYEMLESYGLKRTYIPEHLPPKKGCFFFTQPACLRKSKKLLVLISGYAGKWSDNSIMSQSLKHGSQLNYIKRAQALGYDLLIMNNFVNYQLSCGENKKIIELRTPQQHAEYIWQHYVIPAQPESVAIVAVYDYGQVALSLVELYPKVFAIALMQSWYDLNNDALKTVGKRACNWLIDKSPLDTELPNVSKEMCMRHVSAGPTALKFGVPYVVCKSVFRYLEEKYSVWKANLNRKIVARQNVC